MNFFSSRARIALLCALLGFAGCASTDSEPVSTTPGGTPATGYVRDLVPAEFDEFLRRHPETYVVDVRQSLEWDDELGHLETAISIPLEDLEGRLGDLPTDRTRPIAVYDRLDVRASAAARRIAQLGYRDVVTLSGGLAAYRRAGY